MQIALGFGLLVLIGLIIIGVSYLYFVKDYYVEVDDMQTKELVQRYQKLPIDKQDLIKGIVDDT